MEPASIYLVKSGSPEVGQAAALLARTALTPPVELASQMYANPTAVGQRVGAGVEKLFVARGEGNAVVAVASLMSSPLQKHAQVLNAVFADQAGGREALAKVLEAVAEEARRTGANKVTSTIPAAAKWLMCALIESDFVPDAVLRDYYKPGADGIVFSRRVSPPAGAGP